VIGLRLAVPSLKGAAGGEQTGVGQARAAVAPQSDPVRSAASVKDDRVYLGHIRDAIHDIEQYTAGGCDAFMGDRMQSEV
jgi:hypothetical protein